MNICQTKENETPPTMKVIENIYYLSEARKNIISFKNKSIKRN